MKISLIFLIIFTISTAKAEWLLLDTKYNYSAYLRLASIKISNNIVIAWLMYDENSSTSLSPGSTLEQYQVNCTNFEMKTLETYTYSGQMGTGQLIESYTSHYNEWYKPTSASIDEDIYKYLCDLLK
jgi:hypothetical protein